MIALIITLGYFMIGLGVTWFLLPHYWNYHRDNNATDTCPLMPVFVAVLLTSIPTVILWPLMIPGILLVIAISHRDPRKAEIKQKEVQRKRLESDKLIQQLEKELGINPKKP